MKTYGIILVLFASFNLFAEQLKFGVVGDNGRWNKNAQAVLESMVKLETKSLVMPGDNLYRGTYEQAWGTWKKAGFSFDVVAIGNHNDGYANEIKFFQMPGEYFSKTYNNGQIEFIVLNSDNSKNVRQQIAWFERQIQTSQAQQIFIVYHHPSLTVGEHKWTEKKEFQAKIRPLLKTYRSKITAVIVGHDHSAGLFSFDNLPVIISGSTQSPDDLDPVNNVQEGIQVKTDIHFDGQPYWIQQVVSGVNVSEFNFVRAKDSKVLCRAVIQTGLRSTHSCSLE